MSKSNSPLPPRGDKAVLHTSKPPKPRGLSLFKGVIIMMLVALVALIGYGAYLWNEAQKTFSVIGTPKAVSPEERAGEKPISLLLLGIDYREELNSANTDVIMVATLNPNSKTATLVSIPRDTFIDPKGLKASKANSFYSTYLYAKLTEAPEDRNERQGYAMDKIKGLYSDFLDIPIDYISVVDFKTFSDVVDAYNGLTITVDQNMCHRDYADGTNINLKAGEQHLDGNKALDFVRYRKSMNCSPKTKESDDFSRNARQQQVISKLLDKMKTPQGLLKVSRVFEAVSRNVKTDIPSQQIEAMIRTYIGIDNDKIDYIHLEGDWDGRYVRLSPEQVEQASKHLQNQLIPEGPPPAVEPAPSASGSNGEGSGTANS
jgi:LCP family protein required for cell wall assembly